MPVCSGIKRGERMSDAHGPAEHLKVRLQLLDEVYCFLVRKDLPLSWLVSEGTRAFCHRHRLDAGQEPFAVIGVAKQRRRASTQAPLDGSIACPEVAWSRSLGDEMPFDCCALSLSDTVCSCLKSEEVVQVLTVPM